MYRFYIVIFFLVIDCKTFSKSSIVFHLQQQLLSMAVVLNLFKNPWVRTVDLRKLKTEKLPSI